MNKDTCGPAFPCVNHHGHKLTGMTLRDYFAAKAMQGLLVDAPSSKDVVDAVNTLAHFSYTIADAMLKAREQ